MANKSETETKPPRRQTIWRGAKQAGLFVLFFVILIIPRMRRLRRRVWAWTVVRVAALAAAAWCLWRFAGQHAGIAYLAAGIALLLFAMLVRARSQKKTTDDLARELGALVVL